MNKELFLEGAEREKTAHTRDGDPVVPVCHRRISSSSHKSSSEGFANWLAEIEKNTGKNEVPEKNDLAQDLCGNKPLDRMSHTIFQKSFKRPWGGGSWSGSCCSPANKCMELQGEQGSVSSWLQPCPLQSDSRSGTL